MALMAAALMVGAATPSGRGEPGLPSHSGGWLTKDGMSIPKKKSQKKRRKQARR